MTDFSIPRKWLWPIVAGVLLVVAIVGYAVVASRGGLSGLTGSESAESGSRVTGESGEASGTQAGTGSTSAGQGAGKTATAGKGTFYIRILWWNDTTSHPPKDTVITWSGGSWSPDASLKSQVTTIGPFPTGKSMDLTVYPDGKAGMAAVVPFTIRPTMLSGSERDGIHIELRDDTVHVLGNAVRNFEQDYPRR